MATSINLRINDELENKLKEKVKEIKKVTPVGAEVNNSSIVRGALVDFFNKIDRENAGEKTVKYNLKKLSDEELKEIESLLSDSLDLINAKCESEKVLFLLSGILNGISTEALSEMIDRRG